ncbi:MAG: peptidyl-prolyl cis-trans isomerase [Candidatus Dadabacteria bacterium]|nr:MAG: peptidyl-prolyl cis-trans isomerase [Candidatus Dadabacteria bacterium]
MKKPSWAAPVALIGALALSLLACSKGQNRSSEVTSEPAAEHPVVIMKTNLGTIEIELYPDKAPVTVKNFLDYVDSGFYDGTIFHRVIKNFMIQGGGYDTNKHRKPTRAPIKNEADNGLKNEVGTIAMARTSDPDSATAQFFINVRDNPFLDFQSKTPRGWGYAVFGRVVKGMDVVRKIENTPTKNEGGPFQNLPVEPVVIESIRRKQG